MYCSHIRPVLIIRRLWWLTWLVGLDNQVRVSFCFQLKFKRTGVNIVTSEVFTKTRHALYFGTKLINKRSCMVL